MKYPNIGALLFNTPLMLHEPVAQQLAELRGTSAEAIGAQTTANFHRLFARTASSLSLE